MLPGIYDAFQHWGEQTVWIYSDPHFSDEDLECGIKNRPSDEEQIANINSCAGRKDTLIILGDVGNIECVRRLRAAHKVLIMGNHDSGATKYKREVVKKIFDRDIHPDKAEIRFIMEQEFPGWNIRIEEEHDFHCPFERWIAYADNMLFDEVYEGALMIGEKLILSHEPVDIPWAFNLHGHVHSLPHGQKSHHRHFNCCSDAIGYKPINLNQWLKQGYLANIQTIHRATIDSATERKAKRGGKKIGAK
jgi:calcineurin-like phosphoesterase family protein